MWTLNYGIINNDNRFTSRDYAEQSSHLTKEAAEAELQARKDYLWTFSYKIWFSNIREDTQLEPED